MKHEVRGILCKFHFSTNYPEVNSLMSYEFRLEKQNMEILWLDNIKSWICKKNQQKPPPKKHNKQMYSTHYTLHSLYTILSYRIDIPH